MRFFRRTGPDESPSTEAASATISSDAVGEAQANTNSVAGERDVVSVNRVRSIQSRVTNVLAIGLMSTLGVGLLGWYYTQVFARQSQLKGDSQSASKSKAPGEIALPPLGRVDAPVMERVLGPAPPAPLIEDPATEDLRAAYAPVYDPIVSSNVASHTKTPEELALERRLSGPVFNARLATGSSTLTASSITSASAAMDALPMGAAAASDEYGSGANAVTSAPSLLNAGRDVPTLGVPTGGEIGALLEPTVTPVARANVLPTQRLLLAKGSFVDCTLETAVDSTLPGLTTCITATDTFSVDGSVVLLERGTKLVGETRGEVRQGSSRVFVLWTEARTPAGVVVPLASPATDELGRSGLVGQVNRHFWERFGAAILISVIDGAVQNAVQSSQDDGTVVVSPSGSRDIMTEVLRNTINIPPTVTKRHGDRIAVLVARDLDFRSVYELRAVQDR